MISQGILREQLKFYKSGHAGCLFAAYAAKDPAKYGWQFDTCKPDSAEIDEIVTIAIEHPEVSTQSILFPEVTSQDDLVNLLNVLRSSCKTVVLDQQQPFEAYMCLGFRARVGTAVSWMPGFGNFSFLPLTRQAPYTEISFRAKPRPDYDVVMKEAPEGVLHLADMDMKGMRKKKFVALWDRSFKNTRTRLGHDPDWRTKAKTTYAIPMSLWRELEAK